MKKGGKLSKESPNYLNGICLVPPRLINQEGQADRANKAGPHPAPSCTIFKPDCYRPCIYLDYVKSSSGRFRILCLFASGGFHLKYIYIYIIFLSSVFKLRIFKLYVMRLLKLLLTYAYVCYHLYFPYQTNICWLVILDLYMLAFYLVFIICS